MKTIEDSLQRIPLKQIAQTPFAYALYVITTVLVSVNIANRSDCHQVIDGKNNEIDSLRTEVKAERREKDQVFKAYLTEKMVNDQIQQTVDSAAIIKNRKK